MVRKEQCDERKIEVKEIENDIRKKQCEERCKEERGIEQRVTIRPDQY